MKYPPLFFLLACCMTTAFAQAPAQPITHPSPSIGKPPVDSTAINSWPNLLNPALSNDGAWFMYVIGNQPAGYATLVIQDIKGLWKKAIVLKNRYYGSFFSGNSKQAIFKDSDTLHIVTLGTNKPEYTIAVSAYTPQPGENVKWLAYRPKEQPTILVLHNLFTNSEQRFDSVSTYSFGNNGNCLLLQTQNKQEKSLRWLNLRNGKLSTIWASSQASIRAYNLDEEGKQVAFIVQNPKDSQVLNSLWYYHTGMDKAMLKADEHAAGIDPGLEISDAAPYFNAKGHYIFLKLRQRRPADRRLPSPDEVKVTIWSYKDKALQLPDAAQNPGANVFPTEFTAAASTTNNRITRLEQEDEYIFSVDGEGKERFVIVYKINNKRNEDLYRREEPITYYLLSLQDGTRKQIAERVLGVLGLNLPFLLFSPQEDYLVYFKQQHYFCYNILSGETRNISKAIPAGLTTESNGYKDLQGEFPVGIAGWMADGSLLIYDNYDIWQVDISGTKPPVNITRGYGQSHHIQFRIAFEKELFNYMKHPVLPGNAALLLTATSKDSKYMGVYRIAMGIRKDPELLTMGPWRMAILTRKAANTSNWIVQRESPTQAPNYFFTNNFKDYHPLTDIQPQQAFNWMQVELINFKQLDGAPNQGILYKPEDFDPHKKYPLIINYYETHTDEVFAYQAPGFTEADINIPWFVNRGYLVFQPDIHYQIGEPGSSAYNSIMGGVQYLSRMPWVDTARMGLHGHSFGAYETNYIITHSHLFAAASEAAGLINLISFYGTGALSGTETGAAFAERGQFRMGSPLWERPDLYIKNSPVFKIDQVTTPLLMMHNRKDANVPWYHGLELFTSLRRLNKKVWMLQYDEGGHGVGGKEAVDYTTRLTQFFDHYLKGALPPKWMMEGPPEMKDKTTAFDLDTSGIQP